MMLPSIKKIAISEALFAATVVVILILDRVGGGGPDSMSTGILLIAVCVVAIGTLVINIVCLPIAILGLVRDPAQRTPLQVAVILGGFIVLALLGGWLGVMAQQR